MNSLFDVIADPSRRRLLDVLLRAPRPVGELVAATDLSQPTTSRHLRILREAGLVTCHTAGRKRIYEIRPQGFTELADWLTPYVLLLQSRSDTAPLRNPPCGPPQPNGIHGSAGSWASTRHLR
jgi:DNA-binding transcriptional ArsR family regulator